jgi:hypothetical protein
MRNEVNAFITKDFCAVFSTRVQLATTTSCFLLISSAKVRFCCPTSTREFPRTTGTPQRGNYSTYLGLTPSLQVFSVISCHPVSLSRISRRATRLEYRTLQPRVICTTLLSIWRFCVFSTPLTHSDRARQRLPWIICSGVSACALNSKY